jgi:hypothetical protein
VILTVIQMSLGPRERSLIFSRMKRTFALVLLFWLAQQRVPAENFLFTENFSHGLPADWESVAFFEKRTDYSAIRDGTNHYLHAVAFDGCSALSTKLNVPAPGKLILRWRWRIHGVNPKGTERDLATFDHAARVFIAFDTFIGPPRTLNYLWGNVEQPGTMLDHPKSGRAKIFVVESGNGKAGQWVAEERDVTADWARAFGEAQGAKPMPKVVGLGVMTDSDSLGGTLIGDYANIELVGR